MPESEKAGKPEGKNDGTFEGWNANSGNGMIMAFSCILASRHLTFRSVRIPIIMNGAV
jgi:hypothetical protein